jgi:hypothetical protein
MTNSFFDLSLVICTRNRAARLAETLKKVSAIRSQLKWEPIIADKESMLFSMNQPQAILRAGLHPDFSDATI